MARFSGFCCLLLICSWYQVCMGNPFLVGITLFEKAMLVYDSVGKIQELHKLDEPSNADLYNKLKELSDDFQDLKHEVLSKISTDLMDKLTIVTNTFFDKIKDIDSKYKFLLQLLRKPGKFERENIKRFAEASTTVDLKDMHRVTEVLYESFTGPDYKENSLLSIIAKNSSAQEMICIKQQSKQQLINNLYKAFVESSVKGLTVLLFSYDTLAQHENATYTEERKTAKENFQTRMTESFKHYKNALKMSSREMYRCDPWQHKKHVTYDKLQEVFQAFLVNEIDTADGDGRMYAWKSLSNTCPDMKDVRLRCSSRECLAQLAEKRCLGHIRDCQEMPKWFQVCHSPPRSERRYDWMRVDDKLDIAMYGRFKPRCNDTQGIWNAFLNEDQCICNCESEDRAADRYFSLQDVLSDVDDNKVVTGVQLTKLNHVFHIKIKQGTLGPSGNITDQPRWKDTSEIWLSELLDDKISTYHYDGKGAPRKELKYQEWVEFYKNDLVYTVTYKQNKVYLDTVDADPNRVVTGLRFKQAGDDLKLEIRTTPFDYTTGKLDKVASTWKSNENDRENREELILSHPDDPTRYHRSSVDSTDNQFIQFRMTDLEKDFGQLTVPFIDLQEVVINPPLPLSGVGMIHRGEKNSGGYLGLKVIHYDYTDHL